VRQIFKVHVSVSISLRGNGSNDFVVLTWNISNMAEHFSIQSQL